MPFGNTAESDLLKLLVQNTTWANVGSAGGLGASATAGSLFVSLHTATLTGSSTQTTSEAAYTGYSRVGVARSSAGWTLSGSSPTTAANAAAVTFPACTGGSETETNFSASRDTSGAGELMWYGALGSSLAVSNGITPSFPIGTLQVSAS